MPDNNVGFRFGDRVRIYRNSEFFGEGHVIGVASVKELDFLHKEGSVWIERHRDKYRVVESIMIASPIFLPRHDHCYYLNKRVGQDVWHDENWSTMGSKNWDYTVTNLSVLPDEEQTD